MTEIWKSLKGIVECGDNYEVSNFGNIRNNKGKIMKTAINEKGYVRIGLMLNRKRKMYRVHRLVALAFIPNPDNLIEVNHKDGDKQNCNVSNLEWSTKSHNIQHSFDNDLNPTKGEMNKHAVLTEDEVRRIRELYSTGKYRQQDLADMFDISRPNIQSIVTYKSWKHVV